MDKDIAVLIIHALIKQLGMHRAGSRHGKRRGGGERESSERKTAEGKRSENKRADDRESVKPRGGSEYFAVGFLHTVIHGQ